MSPRWLYWPGAKAATATYHDSAVDGVDRTEYTFALATINETCKAVIGVLTGSSGDTVSTLTIGGVSASNVFSQAGAGGGSGSRIEIWQADVTSGNNGDVVVTLSASGERCAAIVYRVTRAASAAHDTAGSTADPLDLSIDVLADGVVIGFAYNLDPNTTFTWSSNMTEDVDGLAESSTNGSAAHGAFSTTATGVSITADPASSTLRIGAAVSFGPET